MNDHVSAGAAAVLGATRERGPGTRVVAARFALEIGPVQDPAEVAAVVAEDLAELAARLSPLSPLDPGVLVVEISERTFEGVAQADAFAAGHLLAERYGVVTAEPDLPTAYFPEARSGAGGEESVDDFPPGCWVPAEPALADRARWALDSLRVPEAWAFARQHGRPDQGAGVVVAQPDTGVVEHAELAGVTTVGGYDVLEDRPGAADPLGGINPGHGTGTASVLVSSDAPRVIGSAPKASHMPIRAVESVVRITQVTVARAIDRAVAQGAHVVTMSLGGLPAASLHRAVRRAVDADVIVLAAAGNCLRTVVWPARYAECIAVGGTNSADRMWPGSCRGAAVDVAAPAQNVPRAAVPRGFTPGGDDIGGGQGTSFAVALTAGVAALWLAYHGRANLVAEARARGETLQAMFLRLAQATARRPRGWQAFALGAGIVDAQALLEADLDLGCEREAAHWLGGLYERAAVSVASLVAETVRPEAAVDDELDWHRHGPELAAVLLENSLTGSAPRPEAVGALVSGRLAGSVRNPALREALGLDKELPPEVGESGGER